MDKEDLIWVYCYAKMSKLYKQWKQQERQSSANEERARPMQTNEETHGAL
jgi:hypothetical protein